MSLAAGKIPMAEGGKNAGGGGKIGGKMAVGVANGASITGTVSAMYKLKRKIFN